MNKPTISIIVPVYNVEKYLPKCLDSILSQTFTNWEAVLVDDGSKDKSGEICDEYAKKDPRFVVVHKQNEGVAKARITAFDHSKGDLITFIDADDYVASDYIEKLSKPILEDDADMVSCNYFDVSAVDNQISSTKKVMEGFFYGDDINTFIANHYFYDESCQGFGMTNFLCTKMVRREYVHNGLSKGIGMWFGEDQIAMFAMLYQINKLCLIKDRLYYYVHYKEQATKRYELSLWESLNKMFESYQTLDTKHIATRGLRIRTWLYITRTIHSKMIPSGINKEDFANHLSKMRRTHYMIDFFRHSTSLFGVKQDFLFWLLKLRLFKIYYWIMSTRRKRI